MLLGVFKQRCNISKRYVTWRTSKFVAFGLKMSLHGAKAFEATSLTSRTDEYLFNGRGRIHDRREIDSFSFVYTELIRKELGNVYVLPNRARGAGISRRDTLPVIAVEAYGLMSERYIIDGTVFVQITWLNLWSDRVN